MSTLNIYSEFRTIIENALRNGGSRQASSSFTIAGEAYETTTTVADDYNLETLWASGDGGVDDFDFLWFESDEDVLLQLKHGANYQVISVRANVPFMLSSDDVQNTQATDGVEQSSLDTVDQIDVHRNAADEAGDATVRLVLLS